MSEEIYWAELLTILATALGATLALEVWVLEPMRKRRVVREVRTLMALMRAAEPPMRYVTLAQDGFLGMSASERRAHFRRRARMVGVTLAGEDDDGRGDEPN